MRRSGQSFIGCVWGIVAIAMMASSAAAADSRRNDSRGEYSRHEDSRRDDNRREDSRRDNATVSFGEWRTDFDPPLDRVATPVPPMGAGNHHEVIPNVVTITEGSAVNFIISGAHQPQIYDDHKKPEQVDVSSPLPGSAGGLINDPDRRVFRGLDPNLGTTPRDRVEVVHFAEPGLYLVVCGVVNHFVNDRMYGYVRVVPERPKK
jgi:hypothetical protein